MASVAPLGAFGESSVSQWAVTRGPVTSDVSLPLAAAAAARQ